jgi:hypothetical protein
MHVSSRWYVTAVFALGALGCSDPVAPPAQGAILARVRVPSPPIAEKQCRVGGAFSFDVPDIASTKPVEALDQDTYLHRVVDGENGASVSCSVSGSSTFTFSGEVRSGAKGIRFASGTLGADLKGTAVITIIDSTRLSTPLASPGATCVIDAAAAANNRFQVKGGSIWASYSCPTVEAPPTDACAADGIFVLENCAQ